MWYKMCSSGTKCAPLETSARVFLLTTLENKLFLLRTISDSSWAECCWAEWSCVCIAWFVLMLTDLCMCWRRLAERVFSSWPFCSDALHKQPHKGRIQMKKMQTQWAKIDKIYIFQSCTCSLLKLWNRAARRSLDQDERVLHQVVFVCRSN